MAIINSSRSTRSRLRVVNFIFTHEFFLAYLRNEKMAIKKQFRSIGSTSASSTVSTYLKQCALKAEALSYEHFMPWLRKKWRYLKKNQVRTSEMLLAYDIVQLLTINRRIWGVRTKQNEATYSRIFVEPIIDALLLQLGPEINVESS